MSQSAVGPVYGKVIDAVCEQSQVDFEEGGIDQGTLDLLKSGWRKKLTDLKVAQLPWDPTPVPSVPAQHTPSASANNAKHQPTTVPSNGNPMPTPLPTNNNLRANDGTRIKPEPGSYSSPVPQPNGYVPPMQQFGPGSAATAKDRAAMNLQQSYGIQAQQQISQLRQSGGQQRPQGAPSGPYPKMEDQRLATPYSKMEEQKPPISYPQLENQNRDAPYPKMEDQKPLLSNLPSFSPNMPQPQKAALNSAQTDGASDSLAEWKAEVARRRELAAQNPGVGDRLIREHFLELQQRLEGGGLMMPLDERHGPSKSTKRKIRDLANNGPITSDAAPSHSSLAAAQGDAAADDDADEEVDEDAINSDLDDSDQQEDDENNEENTNQVMLCTYDKVQRVKNKWKCTLKDGIVKVGSTDYVFHKGQGEFEW